MGTATKPGQSQVIRAKHKVMGGKLCRYAQHLQFSGPELSSPADPSLESLGHPALFLLRVQIKWQNAQPPPGPSKTPAAARRHPELQPAGDTPVPSLPCHAAVSPPAIPAEGSLSHSTSASISPFPSRPLPPVPSPEVWRGFCLLVLQSSLLWFCGERSTVRKVGSPSGVLLDLTSSALMGTSCQALAPDVNAVL